MQLERNYSLSRSGVVLVKPIITSIITFFLFLIMSSVIRITIMSYYPQYTYFAHVLSSFLIAIGFAFSIPFIFMKYLSLPPNYSPKTKKRIQIGFTILVFVSSFLGSYFGNMPKI